MVKSSAELLIAVDIGNTNVTIGLYEAETLKTTWRISSTGPKTADEFHVMLRDLCATAALDPRHAKGIVLCSVVPRLTPPLSDALRQLTGLVPLAVVSDIPIPITNQYQDPIQVGHDRLVNAFSAWTRYGGPLIIVDFGTAITLDVVTKDRRYLGGVIAPGVEISLDALSARTALLPRIELEPQPRVLGTSTPESIRSGLLHGFGALCDGLVNKLKAECAPRAQVIATGGYAKMISTYCQTIDCVNPGLTLDGLKLLWDSQQA